jgi:hypothetical protein
LSTYQNLSEKLPFIPFERIKKTLSQNCDFIWNSPETYSHIGKFDISEEEKKAIFEAASNYCGKNNFAKFIDLPLTEIIERNYELSSAAVYEAVYKICLSCSFEKRGSILTRRGYDFDAFSIIKEYCRNLDKCSLDDLIALEKEITGETHRVAPIKAANDIMICLDGKTYIADKYVDFDLEAVDKAIDLFVTGDYIALKSFITFASFPNCGQRWNSFLLESYCRRFSAKFRFEAPSSASQNAGVIVRKTSALKYMEILSDAVAKSQINLNDKEVCSFLYEAGFIGKKTTSKVREIIDGAMLLRKKRV